MKNELEQIKRRMNRALNQGDPNAVVREMFNGIETILEEIDKLERQNNKLNEKINELVKKSVDSGK